MQNCRKQSTINHSAQYLRVGSSLCTILAMMLALSLPLSAATDDSSKAADSVPLFRSSDTLELSISAPWHRITRDEDNQAPYPATMTFVDGNGQTRAIQLTVERRGITRQRVCRFPPIKLRFEREDVADTLFAGNKSIKMVTHCDSGRRWDQYYIKEMLAYQIYNLITDRSFRTRPLTISYHDSERDETDAPHFAFLIEDDKLVAKRNGLKTSDAVSLRPDDLDSLQSSRLALFQYLIGNLDWSVLSGPEEDDCCHNSKPIAATGGLPVYALPYDFDSSGLVDAHYAAPPSNLPIRYVTQRLYRGFCAHNNTLTQARAEFIALESDIINVINSDTRLRERSRKRARNYLEDFFTVLADDSKFQRKITSECRK